jgi:hypothetical protein
MNTNITPNLKHFSEYPSTQDIKEIQNMAYNFQLSTLPKEILTEEILLRRNLGGKAFRSPMFVLGSVLCRDWNQKNRERAKIEFNKLLPRLSFEGLQELTYELTRESMVEAIALCKKRMGVTLKTFKQEDIVKLSRDENPLTSSLAKDEIKRRQVKKAIKEEAPFEI